MANVCQTCGDQGFVEALIHCDSCKIYGVHRYCLNITPVPFDDYITWFCETCDGSDNGSDCKDVDQTAKLRPILKTSEIKETSYHTPPILAVEDYVEPVKVSSSPTKETWNEFERQEISDSQKPQELASLVTKGASSLETSEKNKKKKKKKKRNSNHFPQILPAKDATSVEPAGVSSSPTKETRRESEKREISDSGKPQQLTSLVRNGASSLETSENKKKKRNSNHFPQILAVKGATSVEPAGVSSLPTKETRRESERREVSDSGKPHESSTSKKRKSSSGNRDEEPNTLKPTNALGASNDHSYTQLSTESRQFDVGKSSFNMPQTSEGLTAWQSNDWAKNQDKALPIIKPIWRGSISVIGGSIHSIEGIVAHLSSLACRKVHDTASSLHTRLSAEIFPRMEIWPKSFLKNGGAKDESIALYFFPSSESNEKVFYSLVLEMKKNDFAMRCVLDNAELLLFTSYTLPIHCWSFRSKEYLWGVFRAKHL